MKYIAIIILPLYLLMASCGNTDDHGHAHEEDAHAHEGEAHAHEEDEHGHEEGAHEGETHEEGEEAELTALQMEKIGLTLGGMEQKNLSSTLKVNGTLEIPAQNKASVSTLMEGRVVRIYVRPGQYIKKGGLLASIQNPDFIEIQQKLEATEGELIFLEKEYERQKTLVEKEVAARKQFEKITSDLTVARANRKGLRSKLSMLGISPDNKSDQFVSSLPIRSPIGGYVRMIEVNTGAYVKSDQELFEIVDNHHIHIDLKVFEKDLPFLKIGQAIDFSLQSDPSKVRKASIFAIGKALDEQDRTVTVHAEMDNKNSDLLPGMYVEARIITENQTTASLPEAAVIADKGLFYIFVKEEEHGDVTHFKKVQVLTGEQEIGYIGITPLEPLAADAEIVIKGAYFLMAQTKKGEAGGGHHH